MSKIQSRIVPYSIDQINKITGVYNLTLFLVLAI